MKGPRDCGLPNHPITSIRRSVCHQIVPVRMRQGGRKMLTALKKLKRAMTPAPRFALPCDFDQGWTERILTMAECIQPHESVLDLGCGPGWLQTMLADTNTYYGCDRFRRDEKTILADFNRHQFPGINVDVAFISGVMEYVVDWEWFLTQAMAVAHKVVLSYCTTDQFPDVEERRKKGWINDLALQDLRDFFVHRNRGIEVISEHAYGTILVATQPATTALSLEKIERDDLLMRVAGHCRGRSQDRAGRQHRNSEAKTGA